MIHTFDVKLAHGISLSCRAGQAWGPPSATPRVLMLHGFPEAAFVWDDIIQRVGSSAQCLAPNLRGFERSSAPADVGAYRAKFLVQDVAELVTAWGGAPLDLLVAHDWGGAVAWSVAAHMPHLLKQLLIINSPHPATFLRELKGSPVQQSASSYMNFFCRPDAAAMLRADDYQRLWRLFTHANTSAPGLDDATHAPWLDEATRARYREVWDHGLEGGLNYYRASPLKPPVDADSPIHRVALAPADVTVNVPTTVLWGELDVALPPALLDGLEAYVPSLRVQRLPDATHWVMHEQPALVADTIKRLLTP